MSKLSGKTSQIAEKFAQNWQERRLGSEGNDEQEELDDSLTNLQWLHNITLLDITPTGIPTDSSPASSPRSSEDDLAEISSDKSDADVVNMKQERKIDYMSDPHRKPPYSYATLICMAMRETKKSKITLSAIYKWIRENFVYYRHADPTWQNSIRHNLSLNKCFVKVARRKDEPGKGGFWKIDPAYADMFVDGVFKRRRSSTKSPRKSSSVSSKAVRSKSTSNLPTKRPAWNDIAQVQDSKRLRVERPTLNYYRHNSDFVDMSMSYFEEEIPPYTGGLKQDLSWNSFLADTEGDISFRDALDSQGIIIDHNFRVLNSPFTTFTPATPPTQYDHNDVFIPEDNLDLTIHGVGLITPHRMPPSPPRMTSDHPWAEDNPHDVMASLDFLVQQDMGQTY